MAETNIDESHRLKPMKPGYNQVLFHKLFSETEALRRKLAYEIDARRFGLEYKDILSCFNIKFIHAFNKYAETKPDTVKGYIINSLQLYKNRIIKIAYQDKFKDKPSDIDITVLYDYGDIDNVLEDSNDEKEKDELKESLLNIAMSFLKDNLSADAFLVLDIEINPPQIIITEMGKLGKDYRKATIPDMLIAKYLGLGTKQPAINYINRLRIEIKNALQMAKEHFSSNNLKIVA